MGIRFLPRLLRIAALAGLAALCPGLAAQVPETSGARALLADTIFAPVRQAASAGTRAVMDPDTGEKVYFRPEVQGGALYLLFSRTRDGSAEAEAGTYIIKRSMANGQFLHAKVFLQSDPGFFLRIWPWRDRTLMDVYVLGEPLQKGVIVREPFDRLLTAPFSELQRLTEGVVDWSLLLPSERTSGDQRLERLVRALRPQLTRLADVEDGAMDADGRFVYIRDSSPQRGKGGFNCSGFSKFVVDGFYRPLMKSLTDIDLLKSKNLETRKNPLGSRYEDSRDPYFGLDWSRNLARILEQARTGGPLPPPEFADVRDVELFPYRPDIGYPIESIRTVLYLLWKREPGTIYLGSVNRDASDGAPVRAHHHIAVFFPYQDGAGVFRLVAMERNVETSTASLQRRFPGEFVHLVRISSEGDFALP
jgi:hypothetical protein